MTETGYQTTTTKGNGGNIMSPQYEGGHRLTSHQIWDRSKGGRKLVYLGVRVVREEHQDTWG